MSPRMMMRVREKVLSEGTTDSLGEREGVLSKGELLSKTKILRDYSL